MTDEFPQRWVKAVLFLVAGIAFNDHGLRVVVEDFLRHTAKPIKQRDVAFAQAFHAFVRHEQREQPA